MRNIILFIILGLQLILFSSCSTPKKTVDLPSQVKVEPSIEVPMVEIKCQKESSELSNAIWLSRPSGFGVVEEARFFLKNSQSKDVISLPSGVQYKILRSGCGQHPLLTNTVKVRYHMTLLNGKVVDSSYNRHETPSFILGSVIPGWYEAVALMQAGAIWEIYIPSYLAYGTAGSGPIPKNAPLIFTVELIEFY